MLTNIRFWYTFLKESNTTAYDTVVLITLVKGFIAEATELVEQKPDDLNKKFT